MSRIPNSAPVVKSPEPTHLNWMVGGSFAITNPILRLRISAASCFFGEPMYYHVDGEDKRETKNVSPLDPNVLRLLKANLDSLDSQHDRSGTPAELLERTIDAALDHDVEATLVEAVRLRTEDHMRTTPQVIFVRAAHHKKTKGTTLLTKYVTGIVQRADEPSVVIAYHQWRYKGKPIPNGLKRALARRLTAFNAYQLGKYRGEGKGVKLVDVVNLVHPKANDALTALMKNKLTTTDQTWEAIISANKASKESWQKAIPVMGHMALLRNLRNFLDHDVPYGDYLKKLVDTAPEGKQLPFRYYSAWKAIEGHTNISPPVQDAVETCLMASLGNLPKFPGRLMSLCDNSGSAQKATTSSMGTMRVNDIANLTGVLTGYTADEGYVGVFGDRLDGFGIRTHSSIFDNLKTAEQKGANVGANTEHGVWLFWEQAIRLKEHWDTVFIYSDMQAGIGQLYGNPAAYGEYTWGGDRRYIDVAKLIATYRKQVNKKVTVFCVQVAGYDDALVPENFYRTHLLGGWGDGILRYARRMADIADGLDAAPLQQMAAK